MLIYVCVIGDISCRAVYGFVGCCLCLVSLVGFWVVYCASGCLMFGIVCVCFCDCLLFGFDWLIDCC